MPRTGYPDFATIHLTYIPGEFIVELKSWKLFLNRYRDRYLFHQAVTNELLDEFVAMIKPREAHVTADWNVRGNVKTTVSADYIAGQ